MDEDLKDILGYGLGTLFGYFGFLWVILQFTQEIHLIIIDTALLIIFVWLSFIQSKINKGGKSKDDKKRT